MKPELQISLPKSAHLPINRCNLPATILGSLTFQAHPQPLFIDSVHNLHAVFFEHLQHLSSRHERTEYFLDYMELHFQLHNLDEAGLSIDNSKSRPRANYLRLMTGWMFNSDAVEAAVLKAWVESRFGLPPRWHHGPILKFDCDNYRQYQQEAASGLYNTHALEAQLDLLYSYCQYELQQQYPGQTHLPLYRGFNHLDYCEVFQKKDRHLVLLLNNLNAFSATKERADEFGDIVIHTNIPLTKIFYYQQLFPGRLSGEDEFCVIGGLYQCEICAL